MKTYGRVVLQLHAFLTLALDGDNWSAPTLLMFIF